MAATVAFAKPVIYMWALIGRADTRGHEKAQMIISYGSLIFKYHNYR